MLVPEIAVVDVPQYLHVLACFTAPLLWRRFLFAVWLNVLSETDRHSEGITRCDRRDLEWSRWNFGDSFLQYV